MATQKFTTTVDGAKDLRDAERHADALGFERESVAANGAWQTSDGEPVFISGGFGIEIESVGTKYIHAEIDGEITPIHPDDVCGVSDAGTLTVTFAERDD